MAFRGPGVGFSLARELTLRPDGALFLGCRGETIGAVREIRSTAIERTTIAPPKWMVNAPQVRFEEIIFVGEEAPDKVFGPHFGGGGLALPRSRPRDVGLTGS